MRWKTTLLLAVILAFGFPAGLLAQGLTTNDTKDDWEEINFVFDSAILSDGYPSLLRLADLLKNNPDYKVRVVGHTDYFGSNPYNEKLAMRRAETVRDFLVKYGASPAQIQAAGEGERVPKVPGRTDEGRFINRRVHLAVTDGQGNTVGAGGVGDAIKALQEIAKKQQDCCEDILKRLDKLDDILALLKDLKDENEKLKQDVAALKQGQAGVEKQVAGLPKPPEKAELAKMMEETAQKAIEQTRPKRFSLLAFNLGPDTRAGNLTFTGKGRFFSPFNDTSAIQAEAEYLHYFDRQEGQFDVGLVNRFKNMQLGLFSSFKRVDLKEFQSGGTLGQAAIAADYLFSRGRIGMFGTKGFLDNPVVNRVALSRNIFDETYLRVVDQIGGSTQIGLHDDAYIEGNFGALFRRGGDNKPGGTIRFVQPLSSRWAFTVEAGLNETLVSSSNEGRVVFGLQFGNWVRPKDFVALKHPVPMEIPRLRYEVLTRRTRTGNDPPVADAGPDQIGVQAGQITLDGSGSYDPDDDPIKFQWEQIGGPMVSISGMNTSTATFTAEADQTYSFRLTVTDDRGAKGIDRVTVTTAARPEVRILKFLATPMNVAAGEASVLTWETENATEVTISGIGTVAKSGTVTVSPTESTTYTLTAKNAVSEVSTTATVVVTPAAVPRILRFAATPPEILPGEQSTLVWEVENATEVSISNIGTVSASGTSTVTPTTDTNYVLTAKNAQGSVVASVTVTVIAPVKILDFVADPAKIGIAGEAVTLRWQTENATEVIITGVGPVPVNGSVEVTPPSDISYTLTAYGRRSSATALVIVRVGASADNHPPVADAGPDQVTTGESIRLDGSKSYDPDGDPIHFSWRSVGSKQAEITGGATPIPVVKFVSGWGEYTFELTVTDDRGASSTALTKVRFLSDP